MQVKIQYDGKIYYSPVDDDIKPQEMANTLYEIVSARSSGYQMKLVGGGFLVIGKEAIDRAVFVIINTKEL